MIVLIVVLGAVYVPVRHTRTAGDPERVQALGETRQLPASWKGAVQKDASGGERWAFGPESATREALFVTRSKLARSVKKDADTAALRREIRRSLRSTGAPKDVARAPKPVRIDGHDGDAYAFTADKLEVRQFYVVRDATLWAFSCQYRPGNEKIAQGCTDIISTWQLER